MGDTGSCTVFGAIDFGLQEFAVQPAGDPDGRQRVHRRETALADKAGRRTLNDETIGPVFSVAFATLAGLALASAVAACSNFGDSTGSTGVPTASPATPTPPPPLIVSPSSISFAKGDTGTQQVTLIAPNPAYYNIGTPTDTCAPNIAKARPSPAPTSTPAGSYPPQVYNITPLQKNGTCGITFEDFISGAKGTLTVHNASNSGEPRVRPHTQGSARKALLGQRLHFSSAVFGHGEHVATQIVAEVVHAQHGAPRPSRRDGLGRLRNPKRHHYKKARSRCANTFCLRL